MNQAVFDIVAQAVRAIVAERGDALAELKPETSISASGLDSLDVATLTVQLDEQIAKVPEQELRQYPQTLGKLADLYARYRELQQGAEVLQS